MNRRRFLASTSSFAAASLLGCGSAHAACGALPSGVQLFTIRDALQRDARAALATLRELGVVEAELYGLNGPESNTLFGLSTEELRMAFTAAGIRVPLAHIGGALTNARDIAAIAKTLGIETVVVALPNEFTAQRDGRGGMAPIESVAALDALASKLDRVGREYRDLGLGFGYHNHHVEFVRLDDVVPYDYLMERTDPELVQLELDLGWLAYSGLDPVEYLEKYAGRVVACHLKDYDPNVAGNEPQRRLVAPGRGVVDFAAVLEAMRETGVAHGFVEIDLTDQPLTAIRNGLAHIKDVCSD